MRNTLISLLSVLMVYLSGVFIGVMIAQNSKTGITIQVDTETLNNIKEEAARERVTTEKYVEALVYGALGDIFVNGDDGEVQPIVNKFLHGK